MMLMMGWKRRVKTELKRRGPPEGPKRGSTHAGCDSANGPYSHVVGVCCEMAVVSSDVSDIESFVGIIV
jgi:hypothetical protein